MGDGECELCYLQMMQRYIRDKVGSCLTVTLKPELPQKTKLTDLRKKVLELAEVYHKVFWIIDLDVVNAEGALNEFKKHIKEIRTINAKFGEEKIVIIINNPCFEFWLLLHFEPTSGHYSNCNDAIKRLEKHLPAYEKTQAYYTKQGKDIFLKLKPKLKDAIANAEKLQFDFDSPLAGVSQMHSLFNDEHIKKIIEK